MSESATPSSSKNIANILAESAQRQPEAVAVKLDDFHLSYAELEEQSARVAGLLQKHEIGPGDAVGVVVPNIPQMPIVYYGILRLGAVVVPMNPLLKEREFSYHLENSGAKAVFAWEPTLTEVRPAAEALGALVIPIDSQFQGLLNDAESAHSVHPVSDDETAVLLYTSGTTGRPKGAELTHHNLLSNAEVSANLFNLQSGAVVFAGLPFFHVFGQTCALNAAILRGATLTLLPRFDAAKAALIIERDRVNVYLGVPTMYVGLLRTPDRDKYDRSSLTIAVSGGAPLPVEVLREFEEVYKAALLEGYGLSETSPVVCFNRRDQERRAGSIGTPVDGAELKIVLEDGSEAPIGEVGELAVRGQYVMKGYWRNPDATAAAIRDGWFYTGDLAKKDDDGYYSIVDRKKDMLLRGGYNVYPREVEEVIYEHPAVAEAAVIGVPDDVHGQEIAAVVALKPGYEESEEFKDELREFVKSRVAAYKYPRIVTIVAELPKGPTGKILKREISA